MNAELHHAADAERTARDAERFELTLTERGLVVRERAEVAA
jgi:hypothetical protein